MYRRFSKIVFSADFVAIVALLASALFTLSWPFALPVEFWEKQIIEYVLFGILYMLNLNVFFPKLWGKGRRVLFGLAITFSIICSVFIMRWASDLVGLDQAFSREFSKPGQPFHPKHSFDDQGVISWVAIFLGLSYISAVTKKLQQSQMAFEVLEKERVTAELSFLKAQINPHFFFNTLHTIYALTDTDPALAKNSIYSLSHMMRYVLYETQNDLTSLRNEISFIEDYIALMKVRIAGNVQIIFEKQPGLHEMQIAPMLFLPFVENAFKHGVNATQPSYVYIEISETDQHLKFEARNSLFDDLGKQLEDNEGIGMGNTRRRLDLLYHGRYELSTERDTNASEYSVTLILKK